MTLTPTTPPSARTQWSRWVLVVLAALFLLFFAQCAVIDADSATMQALHPLNGSVLLALSFWVTQRALARRTAEVPLQQDGAAVAEGLQRSTP